MPLKKYKKDKHKYNLSSSELGEGVGKFEGKEVISTKREDGQTKTYSMEYINEAIFSCQKVENYETETRYQYWADLKEKMPSLKK